MSTALRSRPATERLSGGAPARRAVVRWSWRLFRREWRQQILVLALLSVALIVSSRGPDRKKVKFWEERAWVLPLVAIVITLVFIEVFDDIGAITSVVVLVTGWLWFVSKKRFHVAALTGALTGLAVYLLFDMFLKTPFPRGLLF